MAVGTLLTVLAKIPWGQVVESAPMVADAAAKLWSSASNRRRQGLDDAATAPGPADATPTQTDVLEARLRALDDSVQQLHEQMQASSELIKALAEQNALLVQRIELNRVRLRRFALAASLCGAALGAAVLALFLRA
jgi:hypothetical protein